LRKLIVSLMVTGMLGGPLGVMAQANPIQYLKENGVPKGKCELQDFLGIQNVMACEGYPES
jgi:hypothetical protein